MSGAHGPPVTQLGRCANASPTYVQLTRSSDRRIGIRWKLKPVALRSSSLSGSVVQYAYQYGSPIVRPRITEGSAQLSTSPSPGTAARSGFWYGFVLASAA